MTGATIITNIKSDGSCTANIVTSNTVTANVICGGAGPQGIQGIQGIQGPQGNPTTVSSGFNIDVDIISPSEVLVNTVNAPQFTGIHFDTDTPTTILNAGDIAWNKTDGTLDIKLLNDVTLQTGQELHFYGKASGAIANGDLCQFAGVQGDHILFKKVVPAEVKANHNLIVGVATENIANNNFGYVTWFGKVNNVYTTGWTAGDLLYMDNTSGQLTNIAPVPPEHKLTIAAVIKEATGAAENGIILVRPTFGQAVAELEDVKYTSLTNGQVLKYTASTGVWENVTLAISDTSGLQTALDGKVDENAAITGATKTKITYDAKGLVTAGADATTADIADSTNKRYVTDANLTVIGNTSGTNTGDQILPTRDSLGLDTDDTVTFANLSGTNTGDETQTTIKTKLGAASSSADGYLTSTDWSTFNNKQNALGFAPEDVANKSTSTSLGSSNTLYPSQNAVKVYVDNLLGNENALVYKGTLDCSTNPNYPAASAGNLYIVSVAGKIGGASGTVVDVGDMIICNTDNTVTGTQAAVGQYWNIIEKNIVGAVTGPASSVDSNVAFFDGVTGKVIKDKGLTLSGSNTGDNATNTQYSGLDAAKVNKAGDTMSGDLNMGTNELIGGTAVTDILKLQGTTGNGTLTSPAIQLLTGNNGATTALTVLNNGNIGIGTTSPTAKLQVKSASQGSSIELLRIEDSASNGLLSLFQSADRAQLRVGTYYAQSQPNYSFTNDTDTGMEGGFMDNILQFVTGGSERVRIDPSGNVGIGTTAPSEKLDVSGTIKATGYKSSDGSAGVSGSFTTTDGKTITIKDGLVTSIV